MNYRIYILWNETKKNQHCRLQHYFNIFMDIQKTDIFFFILIVNLLSYLKKRSFEIKILFYSFNNGKSLI